MARLTPRSKGASPFSPSVVDCRTVVATGGTLYRRLFEQPELLEHREDPELPVEQQYAPSHQVEVQEGGLLSQIPGCNTFWVNSLRARAKTLSPQLRGRRERRMDWWKRSA